MGDGSISVCVLPAPRSVAFGSLDMIKSVFVIIFNEIILISSFFRDLIPSCLLSAVSRLDIYYLKLLPPRTSQLSVKVITQVPNLDRRFNNLSCS